MTQPISRREFLRSAGGITFLALTPIGRNLFGAVDALKPLSPPIFTALPYVQPGPEGALKPGAETVRLAWQTVQEPARFTAELGQNGSYGPPQPVARTARSYGEGEIDSCYNYVAAFPGLNLGSEYRYRVRCEGAVIAEGYFTTRQPRGRPIRFVAFGDNSYGDISDRAIAYQAYAARPDFVMNAGDNVYERGLDNEYGRYFFPVYNADQAGPRLGAPLLRSVPFYTVMANHDVHAVAPKTGGPCADFKQDPDSLAYFTNFHLPLNGPAAPAQPPVLHGPRDAIANFRACAGERFPRMANYSYDWGDAHFLCLDSNLYLDPCGAELQAWIERDLGGTDARWKFAVFHHPPFNVGQGHYPEQHMRALSPLFERHGVDFVLSGHEHTYQRTQPLRFAPSDLAAARAVNGKLRLVPGKFTVDTRFDGDIRRRPEGIIYITTGAGGKHLYDPEINRNPANWTRPEDGNVAYVAQAVTDRHSLTVFEIEGGELSMRQVDERGETIDAIRVSKA